MPKTPFIVEVVALQRHHGFRERVAFHAPLPGLAVTESRADSVDVDLSLEAIEGGIVVAGRISAPWTGECRRCLTAVAGTVDTTVEEVFVPDPEEGEAYPVAGEVIDLEPLAREAVVLALPLAPLCRPDCRGLCPVCGADRNTTDCGHDATPGDPRWAALDQLREKS